MRESRSSGQIPARSEALFGRDADVAWLYERATAAPGASELVCITGPGGLGKTRVLETLGAKLESVGHPCTPIIDFYDIDTFRASIVEQVITSALVRSAPTHAHLLQPYLDARRRLEQARISGREFAQVQQEVRQSFIEAYNALADTLAAAQQRIVLLFDTVEQAVDLSDGAARRFAVVRSDASAGGEHWLRVTLPQLRNTLIVLGGRSFTLYGEPVALYADLALKINAHSHPLSGLNYKATVDLARDMLDRTRRNADEQAAGIATAIDLDDPDKLRAWFELSAGEPFWVAILFTLELIGNEAEGILSILQQEVADLPPDESLPIARRDALRAELRTYFLGEIRQDAPPLLLALQCMASLRKGVTPELITYVLDRLNSTERPADLFAQLHGLAVVKARPMQRYTTRGERPNNPTEREILLFLHDELYAWLDSHPLVAAESRQVVRAAALDWYRERIAAAEAERLEAAEQLLFYSADDPQGRHYALIGDDAQRRKRQLQRDMLGYAYEGESEQRAQATAEYQLLSYEAIFSRDAGHETALHQEALRNLYRYAPPAPNADEMSVPSPGDTLTFAALWLLRAAVQYEDAELTRALLSRVEAFADLHAHAGEMDRAFFALAAARARLNIDGATKPDTQTAITAALKTVETALARVAADRGERTLSEQRWLPFFRAEAFNCRGYYHRLNYELTSAIANYRAAVALANNHPPGLPQFRATTLNNLAFALSEQGDTAEALRIARQALALRQRYGTTYDVAYSRSVIARCSIRAGEVFRARAYSDLAIKAMRASGAIRGLLHALPAHAEAYRKVAELLDDQPAEQDRLFAAALTILDEAEQRLSEVQAILPNAKLEILQNRGCLYRSRAAMLLRRGKAHWEEARADFSTGHAWLLEALHVAEANNESPLIRMDILEDLAAVHVHEDEYDHRVDEHLDEAEALAPDAYKVREGVGPLEIAGATRAYWRELGQCRLQRMLSAFGKYDFGAFDYDLQLTPGQRTLTAPPGNDAFLDEAAEHMVIMFAYLTRYNRRSWMLEKARQLTLRELMLNREATQLDRMNLAAYEAARRYNLLYDISFTIAEEVVRVARENLGLTE